jgi:hypothetical protein
METLDFLFFANSTASVDESCTKNEQNQTCKSNIFLQLWFSSFFCRTRFSDSKPFWKRGPKLGALTVVFPGWKSWEDCIVSVNTRHFTIRCAISYAFIENDVLVDYDVSDVMCHHLKRSFNHLTSYDWSVRAKDSAPVLCSAAWINSKTIITNFTTDSFTTITRKISQSAQYRKRVSRMTAYTLDWSPSFSTLSYIWQ